jgi:predicted molibdopterin-dependent oxidoreductase YjgC
MTTCAGSFRRHWRWREKFVRTLESSIDIYSGYAMKTRFVPSTCSYCGSGCGVLFHVADNRILNTRPNPASPVSQGKLCIKGWSLHEHVHAPGRLTQPLMRGVSGTDLAPTTWESALARLVRDLKDTVAARGPDSVAMLASARISNEENYLAQKFMRAVIGTNNVDHCARL